MLPHPYLTGNDDKRFLVTHDTREFYNSNYQYPGVFFDVYIIILYHKLTIAYAVHKTNEPAHVLSAQTNGDTQEMPQLRSTTFPRNQRRIYKNQTVTMTKQHHVWNHRLTSEDETQKRERIETVIIA